MTVTTEAASVLSVVGLRCTTPQLNKTWIPSGRLARGLAETAVSGMGFILLPTLNPPNVLLGYMRVGAARPASYFFKWTSVTELLTIITTNLLTKQVCFR